MFRFYHVNVNDEHNGNMDMLIMNTQNLIVSMMTIYRKLSISTINIDGHFLRPFAASQRLGTWKIRRA